MQISLQATWMKYKFGRSKAMALDRNERLGGRDSVCAPANAVPVSRVARPETTRGLRGCARRQEARGHGRTSCRIVIVRHLVQSFDTLIFDFIVSHEKSGSPVFLACGAPGSRYGFMCMCM